MNHSDLKRGMQVKLRASTRPFGRPDLMIPQGQVVTVSRVKSDHFTVEWKGETIRLQARHVHPA